MIRKDIQITRMQCATIINSTLKFMSYDHNAGNELKEIKCIISFSPTADFFKDLLASKIVQTKMIFAEMKAFDVFALILVPQFGYTNQKLENVICELFDKYEL